MKFKLLSSGNFYKRLNAAALEKLGFKFRPDNSFGYASDYKLYDHKLMINIDTLEDLMAFVREWETVVLTKDTIEIYDDYRE